MSTSIPIYLQQIEYMIWLYGKVYSKCTGSDDHFYYTFRSRIEEQICSADGRVNSNCFDEALQLVVRVLHMKYVQKFINSQLFKNYISELMATIASAGETSTYFAFMNSVILTKERFSRQLDSR